MCSDICIGFLQTKHVANGVQWKVIPAVIEVCVFDGKCTRLVSSQLQHSCTKSAPALRVNVITYTHIHEY